MSPVVERAVAFECEGETLLGIVSSPAGGAAEGKPAVLIIVGGPQYRAGAHRMFVKLARMLAKAGHVVMRFDARGMGDSSGEQRGFERLDSDIRAATDALAREARLGQGTAGVVLWGLCDAASAALLYMHRLLDHRVQGLCVLNPWVRAPETLARAHVKGYYLRRALDPQSWRRLLTGAIGLGAIGDFWRTLRLASAPTTVSPGSGGNRNSLHYQAAMSLTLRDFGGSVLLVLSGNDLTAGEFLQRAQIDPVLKSALSRPNVSRFDLPAADHTVSDASSWVALEQATLLWLQRSISVSAA